MSEKLVLKDLLKQDPGSALVYLYEIEFTKGNFAYFHDGATTNLGSVTMLDYENNSQTNTYTPLPVKFEGMDKTAATKFAQPTISFANATSVFKTAVSSVDYEEMSGLRVIRRTTLRKFLKSEGDSNSPPVEYPRDVFLIDSLKQRSKEVLVFQLQAPFDLQGILLPRRQVVPNLCPWIYQGASEHTENPEYKRARSGCSWHIESKYNPHYTPTLNTLGTEHTVYVNKDNEYVVPSSTSFATYTSGAITINSFYKTTSTATRFNVDGTKTDNVTVNNYWQATASVSSPGTPSDTNTNFNRIRVHSAYSHGTAYFSFVNDKFNDYVTFQDNTSPTGAQTFQKTLLWKTRKPSDNIPPAHGLHWERGDMCSKTLEGCGRRFGFDPINSSSATSLGKAKFSTQVVIPFGGFPGAKNFS
tara:strand:+ start:755 stop:1999 length:1245 start_codon:yes stop_codon:yes gene_type:complete